MSPAAPDARLSNYRLDRLLGTGGMGSVYLARDLALDRDVAIKFISPEKAADATARHRLVREARAAAALDHPNICAVHEVIVEPDGRAAIVMQYIEGETLADTLRRGPLDVRLAISVATDVASALLAAHRRGIIHRDIKPQNIILTPEKQAKLLDFGVAHQHEVAAQGTDTTTVLTTPGIIIGTPAYMSPEQAQQLAIDGRSDLFSLGAVLFECLTGKRPFTGRSSIDVLGAVLHQQPPDVSTLRPELTPQHDEVVRRLLAKHPDDRFKAADELLGALRVLAPDTGRLTRLDPTVESESSSGSVRGRPRNLVATFAVAILLAIAAAWIAWPADHPFQGSILVSNFEDNAGDPVLAEAIREGLTVKLQQSRSLNVLSREQVVGALQRMERSAVTKNLDVNTALELCQREGIPLLLAGSVHKRGGAIWVTVTGIDPISRAGRFSVNSEFQNDSDVFRGLDVLARRVRRQLGESLIGIAQSNQPLDEVTTPSVEALKLYTRAREQHIRGDPDAALPLVAQALEIDPGFAMAHRLIARIYETRGNALKSREHLARAYQFRANLTQKERFHVEASYFKGAGEYEKAVESLTAATNLFPAHGEARYELALAHRDAGDTRKAVEQLELTLSTAPLTTAAYGELVLLSARTGENDRGRATYDAARKRNVGGAKLNWAYAMVLLGEGRTADARQELQSVTKTSGVYAGTARLYLAIADILDGKLRSASAQLESDVLLDSKDANEVAEFIRRNLLARTLLLQERRDDASQQLGSMLTALNAQPVDSWWHERLVAGMLLVRLDDIARARTVLKQLEQSRSSAFAQNCYFSLAGEIALAEGRDTEAIQAFSAAAAQYPRVITTEALARAFTKQRDWNRARAEWRQVIRAKGEGLREHFAAEWVLAHLELARASRAAGDIAAARDEYAAFLELWKKGDQLPAVHAAAAELRSLVPSIR